MTKTTKTTKTTTTTTTKGEYVPRLIINGQVIDTPARKITCSIKNHEVTLNCTFISEHELKNAYHSRFTINTNDKNIIVAYAKIDNKVSATVYINNVIAFSSLSMQAVFLVLHTAYGLSKNSLNNLYIKSNAMRKQTTKTVNSLKVNNTFEF